MTFLQVAATVGVFAAIASSPPTSPGRSSPVLVRRVIDGETIDVQGVGRVHLQGIRTPKLPSRFNTGEAYASEARDRLASLVASRWIVLEYETRTGRNPRVAFLLLEGGECINARLVREGLARVSPGKAGWRLEELTRAEAEARAARRGIWNRLLPPEQYRSRPKLPPNRMRHLVRVLRVTPPVVPSPVPPKIRELEARLRRAGFEKQAAKGSHRKWVHPSGRFVIMSGGGGDDAKKYQQSQVDEAVAAISKPRVAPKA